MKTIIEDYGRVILLVILVSGCLTMFVNFWYGGDSILATLMNGVMRSSTDSMAVVTTNDNETVLINPPKSSSGGFYIQSEDGTVRAETQLGTSLTLEEISSRADAKLYSVGEQNSSGVSWKDNQLLINKTYHTEDLFWAVDADGVEIRNALTADNGINADNYFNETGYYRPLSIATANGSEIISNLSDLNAAYSIAYKDTAYTHQNGAAGSASMVGGDTFTIYDDDGALWFTYNVKTQKWYFYKSGTYCLRVLVCDSKGKSTIGQVYISVAKRLTDNEGSGNNTTEH